MHNKILIIFTPSSKRFSNAKKNINNCHATEPSFDGLILDTVVWQFLFVDMYKAHKVKLYPTKGQQVYFNKACGTARFAYNWALNQWAERYKEGINSSAYSLIKELTKIKRTEYPWMMEVAKTSPQYAIHNVEKAYKKFWKEGAGHPKFKKKGVKDSFVAAENKNQFKIQHKKIWIPRLGWVRCAENLRFEGKVNKVVVKRTADYWFAVISIQVSNEAPIVNESQVTVGVDLGINQMMILNDGTKIANPKPLKKALSKLQREQRRLSKKKKGSNNRAKQRMKVARVYYRITNIRHHAIHNTTKYLVDNYDKIVIEDLNNEGMRKNRRLARQLSDVGFRDIRRQLEYKCAWRGKELVVANRWFPSSKLCSSCGYKMSEMKLNVRKWVCPDCGKMHDRDINAAKNLAKYSPTPEAGESNACGDGKIHGVSQVTVSETGISLNIKQLKT